MRVVLIAVAIAFAGASASGHAVEPPVASSSADSTGAETAEVKLASFRFTPAELNLQAGRPYILKVINTASGGHDFSAPKFFAAATIAPQDAARISGGKIKLRGGETVLIHLVPAAGTFKLACTHFGHAFMGMTGRIIVR